jgi:hypothetical protein
MRGPKINDFIWPKQGNPAISDWEIWRNTIRKVLNRDNVLLNKLGPWLHIESSKWFFSPEEECLFKKDSNSWLKIQPVKKRTRDTYYELAGTSAPATLIYNAHTSKSGEFWVCHGFSTTQTPPSPLNVTLKSKVETGKENSNWCIKDFEASDNGEEIAKALHRTAVAVCDGSFKNGVGSSTWFIEGNSTAHRIKGWNFVPGSTYEQSPYRSELAGLLGVVSMITEIIQLHQIPRALIAIACDTKPWILINMFHVSTQTMTLFLRYETR